MYSLDAYGTMMADRVRMSAYVAALRTVIRPDSVVLDVGTGTGVMACIAARLGARKVYAVEPSDLIHVGVEIARDNGLERTIDFRQTVVQELELPERVDIIVSDLRGVLPMHTRHLEAIADAARRLLKPGGTLIPARDVMYGALVQAPEDYDHLVTPWGEIEGVDLRAGRRRITNSWGKSWKAVPELLSEASAWREIDYRRMESPNVSGRCSVETLRDGVSHGLLLWFDTALLGDIGFSNAPTGPKTVYGQAFCPFPEPVAVAQGQQVELEIRADLVDGDYVWTWSTTFTGPNGAPARSFRQSTFLSGALPAAALAKRADTFVPTLSKQGAVDRFILEGFGHGRSLADVADSVLASFPDRFQTRQAALTRVAHLSAKYSA